MVNNGCENIGSLSIKRKYPTNIIRIETEDESEDFIEIELPFIYEPPLQDNSIILIPASKIVGSIIKGTKGVANLGRSLTREEVLGIVDKLKKVFNRNGEDTNIRLVKSKKELDKVWEQISQNEKDIKLDKDYKGNLMKYKYLDDATTRIQYRTHSSEKSNNLPTIDMHNKVEGIERKIHIDIHQNKGVR